MNNEELIAKIADMAPGLIKEAEESGFEVVRKVDPEVSKEIIKFLLKTPSTLKDILHDVTFAALRHLEAMGELDVDVAKKLEDRLGYGCEVWYKEERP